MVAGSKRKVWHSVKDEKKIPDDKELKRMAVDRGFAHFEFERSIGGVETLAWSGSCGGDDDVKGYPCLSVLVDEDKGVEKKFILILDRLHRS